MKKLPLNKASILLATVAMLGAAVPQSARALSDIDRYPYKSSIELLESNGIVSGYPDGTFRPYKAINRAEFLKLLMLSVYGSQAYQGGSARCFTDFTGDYQWYWSFACTAKSIGVIHGNPDGSFRGEDTIILAEALKMALEAWNVPMIADDPDRQWYERYMDAAATKGVFKRFPYTPDYQITRGEMALLLVMLNEPIASLDPNAETPNPNLVNIKFPPSNVSVCGNGIVEGTEQCDDGNKQTGDGCSDICILVSEPIRHGALQVEQQPISNTAQASGSKDVTLLAFAAIAGRQDVYITTLKFKSLAGSLDFAENYRLLIDRDGDGAVETLYGRSKPSGETLSFGDLNILVKDGAYTRVELIADIDTTLTGGNITVAFDTTQSDFVEGVDKIDGEDVSGIKLNDGQCLIDDICWITVLTDSSQNVSIRTQGNLYVTQSSTIGSRQVVASKTTPSLLLLKFRAESEDILVKKLAVEGVPSTVEHLEFLIAGTSTPFATGRGINCSSIVSGRFCTDNEFTIPNNGEKLIIVRAVLKSDEFGAVSGQSFGLSLSSSASSNVAVEAQGGQSGQQLLQNDGNGSAEGEVFIGTESAASNSGITGPTHTILFAKIADITNSSLDADNSVILAGGMTFAQFAFRATDHTNTSSGPNPATISKLVFTVSAVNMEFDAGSFYLYNTENSGVISSCSASGVTGTITVTCDNLDSSSVNTAISPNDTIDLALHGSVTDSQLSSGVSILQASLQNLSNPGITGTIMWSDDETSIGWVDIGKTSVKSTSYRLD